MELEAICPCYLHDRGDTMTWLSLIHRKHTVWTSRQTHKNCTHFFLLVSSQTHTHTDTTHTYINTHSSCYSAMCVLPATGSASCIQHIALQKPVINEQILMVIIKIMYYSYHRTHEHLPAAEGLAGCSTEVIVNVSCEMITKLKINQKLGTSYPSDLQYIIICFCLLFYHVIMHVLYLAY